MRQTIRAAAMIASFALAAPAVAQEKPGVTSGPATGQPTTLGTGGEVATPHQQDSMKNKGGPAVQNEQKGQAGGTAASVKPGAPDQESGRVTRAPNGQ